MRVVVAKGLCGVLSPFLAVVACLLAMFVCVVVVCGGKGRMEEDRLEDDAIKGESK